MFQGQVFLNLDWALFTEKLILIVVVVSVSLVVAMYSTYAERKVAAFMQDRRGPNRAGPFGILQPLADGLKLFFKEEIVPTFSSKFLFILGPVLAMLTAIMVSAVIPWGNNMHILGRNVSLQIADINSPDYVQYSRFTGIMGGANVQGNFVYTIFMILILFSFNLKKHQILFLFVIAILAVMPTLSKNAIFGTIIILFYAMYEHFEKFEISYRIILKIGFLLFIMIFIFWSNTGFLTNYYNSFTERIIGEGIGGNRIEKLNFTFETLFSKYFFYFFANSFQFSICNIVF